MCFNITWYSIQHNSDSEHKSEIKLTIDTPYLALAGKLWGVCGGDLGENWQRYNVTALYRVHICWNICSGVTSSQ